MSVLPFFAVTRVDLTIDSLQITADALSSVQRPRLVVAMIRPQHVYEGRPRKDKCGVNLISMFCHSAYRTGAESDSFTPVPLVEVC